MKKCLVTAGTLITLSCAYAQDTYNTTTNVLSIPAVTIGQTVYSNVELRLISFTVVSVGAATPVADTVLVRRILKDTTLASPSILTPAGPLVVTTPSVAAAAALQVLKQNDIAVLDSWCAPVAFSNGALSPGAIVSQFMISEILLVARISATDAAKINHKQNPDPLSAFDVYNPTSSVSVGASFDCKNIE